MSERIKQSIPIQGINTAEPCHAVTDGYTEDIHNMRFRNGAFENVCSPKITIPISKDNEYRILYKMDCLPMQSYIALKDTTLHLVSITDGVVESVSVIGDVLNTELKLNHFGNTLYANYKEDGQLVEKSWIYKDDSFVMFSLDSINPPTFDVSYTRKLAANRGERPKLTGTLEDGMIGGSLVLKRNMKILDGASIEREPNEFEYGIDVNELQNEGYIVGDFIIMLAYRLFDGSIVKPSMPIHVSSYKPDRYPRTKDDNSLIRVRYQSTNNDTFEVFFYDKIRGVKPIITLTSNVVDNDIIKSVVILSTRAQCIYDYDNVHKKFATGGEFFRTPEYEEYLKQVEDIGIGELLEFNRISRNHIKDKMFTPIETPFYQIAEFEKESNSIALNYEDHYKDITSQDVYTPSYSLHQIWSEGKYEYNNRLHCYGINMKAFNGYALGAPLNLPYNYFGASESAVVDVNFDVELTIDDNIYIVRQTGQALKYMLTALSYGIALVNPVSYPDARANKIKVWGDGFSLSLSLIKNLSNNLAYYENPNSGSNFIDEYAIHSLFNGNPSPQTLTTSVSQTNKLYVSALNNPFFFAPANIYTIGSNGESINSIETSVEQITETKFGMYPLNIFTNRAIYALEVGNGDVTYQRVIGLSNESKLPGTTTVGAGNTVFFIGEQGVMAIEGRRIYCISRELERYPALELSLCSFDIYMLNANLSYNPVLSELMVCNPNYDYAYVYSLTGKFWSRRDWDYTNIGGSLYEIIIAERGIATAWKEDKASPLSMCTLETRAIKLGSLEYKRIETIVARLSAGSASYYEIWLYGSNDSQKWVAIGKAEKTPMIRRTGASFKYFKVKILCSVLDYFTVTNFDTEFYHRFVRRLR